MDEKLKQLWEQLRDKKMTSLSYDKFVEGFSDDTKRRNLYDILVDKKLVSPNKYDEFSGLWDSGDVKKKKRTKLGNLAQKILLRLQVPKMWFRVLTSREGLKKYLLRMFHLGR